MLGTDPARVDLVRWHAELGWHDARVGPLTAFSLHPATMALHYGQTIFEGMKAFWRPNGQRALFRPVDHARRFARSARRMAMPTLPEQDFVAAYTALHAEHRALYGYDFSGDGSQQVECGPLVGT